MAYTRVSQISNSLKTIGDIITRRKTTLCLKKTPPTFLAITRESIDGFFYNIRQKCYRESKQSYVATFSHLT